MVTSTAPGLQPPDAVAGVGDTIAVAVGAAVSIGTTALTVFPLSSATSSTCTPSPLTATGPVYAENGAPSRLLVTRGDAVSATVAVAAPVYQPLTCAPATATVRGPPLGAGLVARKSLALLLLVPQLPDASPACTKNSISGLVVSPPPVHRFVPGVRTRSMP